jgi:hypothetical protein
MPRRIAVMYGRARRLPDDSPGFVHEVDQVPILICRRSFHPAASLCRQLWAILEQALNKH